MKSLGHKRGGGNVNLRGKLHRRMPCRCCDMWNRKHEFREREARRAMRAAHNTPAK